MEPFQKDLRFMAKITAYATKMKKPNSCVQVGGDEDSLWRLRISWDFWSFCSLCRFWNLNNFRSVWNFGSYFVLQRNSRINKISVYVFQRLRYSLIRLFFTMENIPSSGVGLNLITGINWKIGSIGILLKLNC